MSSDAFEDSVLVDVTPGWRSRPPWSTVERIHRSAGHLTEYSSSARADWRCGRLRPMEKPHETFNAKGFFIDWERLHPVMC